MNVIQYIKNLIRRWTSDHSMAVENVINLLEFDPKAFEIDLDPNGAWLQIRIRNQVMRSTIRYRYCAIVVLARNSISLLIPLDGGDTIDYELSDSERVDLVEAVKNYLSEVN